MLTSKKELCKILLAVKGATFITFTANTDARAKKTGNPFGTIWKTYTVNGLVNFQYDTAVVNRLKKEGKEESEFQKGESWHELVKDSRNLLTPFAKHKETGELYLRFWLLNKTPGTVYTDSEGTELDFEQVKLFLPKPSSYKNQGLDDPVRIQTYKLASIVTFNINDRVYAIEKDNTILTVKDLEL
jgi:hypothetical protein